MSRWPGGKGHQCPPRKDSALSARRSLLPHPRAFPGPSNACIPPPPLPSLLPTRLCSRDMLSRPRKMAVSCFLDNGAAILPKVDKVPWERV